MGSQFASRVVSIGVVGAALVVTLALSACPRSGDGEQGAAKGNGQPGGVSSAAQAGGGSGAAQPSAEEVRRLLGDAPLSDFAYRVYLGEGRSALDELGFIPDREERFKSRVELGELGAFAPRTVDQLGGGTAYFQGDPALDGCLAFQLDNGLVIWVHASADWLAQRLPDGAEYPSSIGEQFRMISYASQLEQGEALGGQGLPGWFQLTLDAKAITVRLDQRDYDAAPSDDRVDFFLGPGRTAELQGR